MINFLLMKKFKNKKDHVSDYTNLWLPWGSCKTIVFHIYKRGKNFICVFSECNLVSLNFGGFKVTSVENNKHGETKN